MTEPKRHHFVPRFYLARFALDGRVSVRRRDGKVFETSTRNVAVECDLYTFEDADGQPSTAVESLLAEVESAAAPAVRRIDESGRLPDPSSDDREALAALIALQITRTPEQRDRLLFPVHVAEYAGDHDITADVVAEYLEKEHLGFKPENAEVQAALDLVTVVAQAPEPLTKELAIETMLRTVQPVARVLLEHNWTLESDRKGRLITSDTPTVIWREPSPRDQYEGVGVENADEIRFPLDPEKQLVLSPRNRAPSVRITTPRVRACNADVAGGCHNFIIGHPDSQREMDRLALSEKRPVLRFNTGPLSREGPDGKLRDEGEVLHMWIQRH